MPIIAYDANGRPRVIKRAEQISRMTMPDLIALEAFLWNCMNTKFTHLAVVDTLNTIHREVEWRAQDPEFE
jgi:hypothetical protein